VASDEPERPPDVAHDAILRVIRVPPESHGMRLDRFLSTQLRATSRTRAALIIENSAFSWQGRRLKPSDRVKGEDRIALWRPALDEAPPPTEITTIYEDDHLLVVNKPALMTVHPTARHHRHTVIRSLQLARPDQHLSLIHRLDRETSGILMLAKTPEADRLFKGQLEQRAKAEARAARRGDPVPERCDKVYLAITWGTPLGGLVNEPLCADPSPLRVKMRTAPTGEGLAARTGVKVLSSVHNYALVRCELYTGRQHQIRVHLAHLGTPIVGDKLYGPDEIYLARGADNELTEQDLAILELPRHALHSTFYRMNHPYTQREIEFEAPLPCDLSDFWNQVSSESAHKP
jgi:23S rRNA pseudouridine1911/1915/1917 synthase